MANEFYINPDGNGLVYTTGTFTIKGKTTKPNRDFTQDITIEGDKLVLNACKNARSSYTWDTTTHMIPASKVVAYLEKNPTLDETKPPLRFNTKCSRGLEYDYEGVGTNYPTSADFAAHKAKHVVPFDILRTFIDSNDTLSRVFYAESVKTVEVERVETIIVESPLAMTDDEKKEMHWALQRQQHIRNEYLRRAYVAGDEEDIAKQLAGMATLKSLMERLEVPMAEWTNNDMALAELPLIEGKEDANVLHGRDVRSDGGGGLEAGGHRTSRKGSRTRTPESPSPVVQ